MAIQTVLAEQVRHEQREEWSAAAPGWQARRDDVSQPTTSITRQLLAMAGITTGQRVLDLACGNGDPSFTIAQRVSPEGYVVGLDITEPMVRNAQAWANRWPRCAHYTQRSNQQVGSLSVPGDLQNAVLSLALLYRS